MIRLAKAHPHHADALARAIQHLEAAREAAKRAKAPRLANAIRHALKSAGGAARHLAKRLARTAPAAYGTGRGITAAARTKYPHSTH